MKTCGCRRAGIMLNVETLAVERCDACNLFDTDEDAFAAVAELVLLLGRTYDADPESTVADAMDWLNRRAP